MFRSDVLRRSQDPIVEDVSIRQGEILRIASAQELDDHFHELLASQLGAREISKHCASVLRIEFLALCDPLLVVILELDPPVCL